ncbi:MAG: MinD/ParA family protein [Chloroflexota bacterium]|nr:MinD/ParA family protein [Anaerolineales bacterium]MCB8966910.1 MinD/ParA family protein [Ardenticatenaceae bacterium]
MSQIISVHSFRGGTGKSNTTANLAATFAAQGMRVGVVDTDIQSPGIHIIFGMGDQRPPHSLNDYLNGDCRIEEAAMDMTPGLGVSLKGRVFLIPSSTQISQITRFLKGYDVGVLVDGYEQAIKMLNLDALLIDTHPGLNNETLMSVSVSDALAVILRPDFQDYQGTAVIVDISRRLGVQNMVLVANKIPLNLHLDQLRTNLETQYRCPVGALLPHSEEMMALGSEGVFVLRYPNHPISAEIKRLAQMLLA